MFSSSGREGSDGIDLEFMRDSCSVNIVVSNEVLLFAFCVIDIYTNDDDGNWQHFDR